jgi:hypothetical protein
MTTPTPDDQAKKTMASQLNSPPGAEFDSKGHPIPHAERPQGDLEKTIASQHDSLHAEDNGIKNPENEAAIPGEMPPTQQGQGPNHPPHHDLEGQQGGTDGGGHE